MATVTTHVLDSVSGGHAAGLGVALYRVDASGRRVEIFRAVTDAGGRLSKSVAMGAAGAADAGVICELVFDVANYFASQAGAAPGNGDDGVDKTLREAVARFVIADPNGAYHIPMLLAPQSYSLWFSAGARAK